MNLIEGIKKYKTKSFMEAVIAGCAMIAYADGLLQSEEIAKLMDYFRIDERLRLFDTTQVLETFNNFIGDFEFDLRLGKEKALRAIRKINKNPEEARLLILVCCAIGKSDGFFSESEKKAIREICMILGLNPAEFNLDKSVSDYQKLTDIEIIKPIEPVIPKSEPKQPQMPDWMKKPPSHHRSPQDNMPEWMRKPPKKDSTKPITQEKPPDSSKDKQTNPNMPEWMRK